MDLTQYSGGDYLQAGYHAVRVQSMRHFTYKSGSEGVEYTLTDGRRTVKLSFCKKETILWMLADFAKTCGLTEDEMRAFQDDHLINRQAVVHVVLDDAGKYHEVENRGWWPADANIAELSAQDSRAASATPVQAAPETTEPAQDPIDDLPF